MGIILSLLSFILHVEEYCYKCNLHLRQITVKDEKTKGWISIEKMQIQVILCIS